MTGVRDAGGIWTMEDLGIVPGRWSASRSWDVTEVGGWSAPRRRPPAACCWCRCSTCSRASILAGSSPPTAPICWWRSCAAPTATAPCTWGIRTPSAVPVELLTHPFYAAGLARDIQPDSATRSLPGRGARAGIRYHSFLHPGPGGQPGGRHPEHQLSLRGRVRTARHRRAAQRRDGRFLRPARGSQRLWSGGRRGQLPSPRASACSRA